MHMLTYHLTYIHLFSRINKEFSSILKFVDGISVCCACFHGNHRTVKTASDIPLVWLIFLESVSHDSLSLTGCEHIGTQADDTP